MNKRQKRDLYRIIAAAVLFVPLFVVEHLGLLELLPYPWIALLICLVPYLIVGYDVIKEAAHNIKNGQIFDENFLMMIATFGAFVIGEYIEAVAVMLFYQIGELFQSYAVGKSRESITALMDICPEYANVEVDGELEEVDPDDVEIGSIIVIKPGEKVPLDGVVIEGESFLDTSALTGESVPRKVSVGKDIISGCINGNGTLRVKTTKEFDDSTVAKILELVENATNKKAKVENFITRFAKYYTPFVTISAVLLAVIPPILLQDNWFIWLERACTFLVVSCPCALVISVPMGFFGGIGAASKEGVLVKGSNYLELLSEMDTIVFDKTGTLTNGVFEVTAVVPAVDEKNVKTELEAAMAECEVLGLAAALERFSTHPIAESIVIAHERRQGDLAIAEVKMTDVEEIAGHGISGKFSGKAVYAGNYKLMKQMQIPCEEYNGAGTVVYVAYDNTYLGCIIISDTIKQGAKEAIADLKKAGVSKTVMLTGDRKEAALAVAKALGIDEVQYELLPGDKVDEVEKLLSVAGRKKRLAFVGDGINDAPVLARADIGFAMGSLGSDAAIEAADIVIMDDDIRKIAHVMKISRKTMAIVKENIVFALGVKGMVLILGAIGMASMWAAVFADVGVAVIAILNSMRTLRK
ncbi:MAG: cadmium-translocating P-type ATPase [Agathobacter sp.]|nr:cadmium-translocating P-type ATPase [Agathobacter sp.]